MNVDIYGGYTLHAIYTSHVCKRARTTSKFLLFRQKNDNNFPNEKKLFYFSEKSIFQIK